VVACLRGRPGLPGSWAWSGASFYRFSCGSLQMVNAACPAEFNDAHWPSFAGGEEGRGSVGGESFTLSSGLRLGPGWFPGPGSCLKAHRFGRGREVASERGCVSYMQGLNLISILEVVGRQWEATLIWKATFAARQRTPWSMLRIIASFRCNSRTPFCPKGSVGPRGSPTPHLASGDSHVSMRNQTVPVLLTDAMLIS
jgi:hypothetical protein